MTLNDLANLGQIIGALAVVISLFYVAHQIRQNTKAIRAATAQSVHEHSQNAFLKWREGLLTPALWLGWEQVMMNLFGAPGGKAFWKERSYLFGEEFRRYIENDLMKKEPHPDAKPLGAFTIARRTE